MCTTCGCDEHVDHLSEDHEDGHVHDHVHGHDHGHTHDPDHDHGPSRVLRLERDLLAKNDRIAATNRRMAGANRMLMLNLIGSPGAGKTALLEATIGKLGAMLPMVVVEGDQATDRDARRIQRAGGRAIQVNTDAGCHLDAGMVADALHTLGVRGGVVFVENVGNLVCPALFDLGERAKVVVMSVTEGDDKPLKYPHVFRAAQRLVLTKLDLLPYVDFDVDTCIRNARSLRPDIGVTRVSARNGDGIDDWCRFVREEAAAARRPAMVSAP